MTGLSPMVIREYRPADLIALCRMHAAGGLDYELPDPHHPIVPVTLVAEEQGRVTMAAMLRLTSEAYLLMDRTAGTPQERWSAFLAMHEAVRLEARDRFGLHDVHAFIPPAIARRFGARLRRLGWQRSQWDPWVRSTEGETTWHVT